MAQPKLNLAAILATRVFGEEDLTHNRRGRLSPLQDAWRAEHPGFFYDDDGHDGTVEMLIGRVAIEGRFVAGAMGQTTFAALVLPGRRLSLRPGIERSLVRDAPYRAYAAYGWIWSIEPITEDELRTATSAVATYRSSDDPTGTARIGRALEEALSIELSFTEADVTANRSGRFSPAQRSLGRKKLVFATSRVLISTAALCGLVALFNSSTAFPPFTTFFGIVALFLFWGTSGWALVDALARLLPRKPLHTIARLDNDPTNRDNLVLESDDRPLKIKRAAIAIAEAPFSVLREWRFEVHFLPWTRSVIAVRPVPPSERDRA